MKHLTRTRNNNAGRITGDNTPYCNRIDGDIPLNIVEEQLSGVECQQCLAEIKKHICVFTYKINNFSITKSFFKRHEEILKKIQERIRK